MIYWILFWTFFKVGLFTIGGGYAMIPLIQEAVIDTYHWMTIDQFTEFIGIAESTPGPFAINISTFAGMHAAGEVGGIGLLGSICSTLGVITPSIVIILLIAAFFHYAIRHWYVQAALEGAKPVVVGLIGGAAIVLLKHTLMPEGLPFQWAELLLAIGLFALAQFVRLGAILIIVVGAGLGLLLQLCHIPIH